MTDNELKDLASAYRVYLSMCELADDHYGKDNPIQRVTKHRLEQTARKALGENFAAAKATYERSNA